MVSGRRTKTVGIGGLVVLAILIIGALAIGGFDFQPFAVSGDKFLIPHWARLECAPDTTERTSYETISTRGDFVTCGINQLTRSCNVDVSIRERDVDNAYSTSIFDKLVSQSLFLNVYYKQCTGESESSCSGELVKKFTQSSLDAWQELPSLDKGESYKIRSEIDFCIRLGFFKTCDTAPIESRVKKQYFPWKLYRFVGGSKMEAKDQDCCFSSTIKNTIPDRIYDSIKGDKDCLITSEGIGDKWINYVDDWSTGPGINIYNHNTFGEVYCTNGAIYDIATIKMADGKMVKIDPSSTDSSDAPSWYNIVGNKLSEVECCPQDPACNDNFKRVSLDTGAGSPGSSCVSDLQCVGQARPIPLDKNHYVLYSCEMGECVKSDPIEVECTNSAGCAGTNEICDLSNVNYGTCIKQIGEGFCGDGKCDSKTESASICSKDCGQPIAYGGDWVWKVALIIALLIGFGSALRVAQKRKGGKKIGT